MRLKLGSRYWIFRFGRTPAGTWGICDPYSSPKTVTVSKKIGEFNVLDTCVHEMLHACDMNDMVSEDWIERTGTEIAHGLWRLGYRMTNHRDK